ncbi:MAG TPA: pitrilysin family protein [Acidobacteriota bacterium]|nr:pitrilysin family protein [Acidobacteriota bacterium]
MNPRLILIYISFVLFAGTTASAQRRPLPPQQPAPSRALFLQKVKSFEETQYVSKVVLKNGMTVLVNEFHALPIVSILTHVKVGYSTEPSDAAGISRLLEQMLFKGTPSRTVGVIRQDTQALGGTVNGSAGYEGTSLETVVPSMQWKKALEIQSDMLLNPSFDAAELKREIELEILQMRGEQDDPNTYSVEKLYELGFPATHLYRWTANAESLRGITREKLLDYYKSFFTPSRTILVIAGDVAASEVLNEVVRLYDKPKAAGEKPLPAREESKQSTFRYSEVRGPALIPRVLLGFHGCAIASDDYPPLEVLQAVLGIGDGSVLSARLRDQKKVILQASADLLGLSDLGFLTLRMEVESKDIDKSEIAALTELELIKRQEPDAAVMERALAQLERAYWEKLQTVTGRSRLLALYESLGDWKGMNRYVARIRQVKPADVLRVAKKYLKLENCSLLEFLPAAEEPRNLTAETALRTFQGLLDPSVEQESAERERETQLSLEVPSGTDNYKFNEIRSQFQTASVLRGPDLFIKEDHTAPLIQMAFFFPGGKLLESGDTSGITSLMLQTMLRGTQDRGPERYLRQMELYGGRVEPVIADDYSGFFLSVLSRNIDGALQLLGDAIKTPKFDKDELSRQKQLQIAVVRKRSESVADLPIALLDQALFKNHPYALEGTGNEKSIAGISVESIQAWYQSVIRNKKPMVVILGDTQGTNLAAYFVKNFSGSRFQEVKLPEAFVKPLEQKIVIDQNWDRNQSLVLIGFQAPPEGDEDSYPVALLQSYLAGSGGKLPVEIIDKQSLGYRVAVTYDPRIRGGSVTISAATSAAGTDLIQKTVEDEFSRLFNNPISYRDFRSAVNTAVGNYWIARQSRNSQIISVIENVLSGKAIDDPQAYLTQIQDVKQDDLPEVARRIFKLDRAVTVRLHGRP